jgi:hypothetical protein
MPNATQFISVEEVETPYMELESLPENVCFIDPADPANSQRRLRPTGYFDVLWNGQKRRGCHVKEFVPEEEFDPNTGKMKTVENTEPFVKRAKSRFANLKGKAITFGSFTIDVFDFLEKGYHPEPRFLLPDTWERILKESEAQRNIDRAMADAEAKWRRTETVRLEQQRRERGDPKTAQAEAIAQGIERGMEKLLSKFDLVPKDQNAKGKTKQDRQ